MSKVAWIAFIGTVLVLGLVFNETLFSALFSRCPGPAPALELHEVGLYPHEIPLTPPPAKAAAPPPVVASGDSKGSPSTGVDKATPGVYAQPPSKQAVWFDIKSLGGFKQLTLDSRPLPPIPAASKHEKWIVVTSINPPTPTIEKLATLKDWHVVLIGDTKTPKDWAYPGITYLDVDAQLALGFSTTQLLRTRSYQRKNIGYLYAVMHGARVIYETDDDNALQVDAVPLVPTNAQGLAPSMLEFASSDLTINHHAHFGQPSSWPRGYPLEAIGDPHVTTVHRTSVIPAVQQGLANGDPDMDAVFRLTRKPRDRRIDFSFNQVEPIALPMGSFGPYNAQNTIFTYEGLWATVLPQTVEFRVCDIWRAYYTQRLLWGTGAQLTFVAPYVYQLRNSHSYHDDYVSEKQIFDQVTRFLQFLRAWRCGRADVAFHASSGGHYLAAGSSVLPSCAYALARDMAVAGYWGPADAELVRHFFHDLSRAGYVFPPWLEPLEEEGGGGAVEWVSPCSAAAGASSACTPPGATHEEVIDYSLPSIELEGTCPRQQKPAASAAAGAPSTNAAASDTRAAASTAPPAATLTPPSGLQRLTLATLPVLAPHKVFAFSLLQGTQLPDWQAWVQPSNFTGTPSLHLSSHTCRGQYSAQGSYSDAHTKLSPSTPTSSFRDNRTCSFGNLYYKDNNHDNYISGLWVYYIGLPASLVRSKEWAAGGAGTAQLSALREEFARETRVDLLSRLAQESSWNIDVVFYVAEDVGEGAAAPYAHAPLTERTREVGLAAPEASLLTLRAECRLGGGGGGASAGSPAPDCLPPDVLGYVTTPLFHFWRTHLTNVGHSLWDDMIPMLAALENFGVVPGTPEFDALELLCAQVKGPWSMVWQSGGDQGVRELFTALSPAGAPAEMFQFIPLARGQPVLFKRIYGGLTAMSPHNFRPDMRVYGAEPSRRSVWKARSHLMRQLGVPRELIEAPAANGVVPRPGLPQGKLWRLGIVQSKRAVLNMGELVGSLTQTFPTLHVEQFDWGQVRGFRTQAEKLAGFDIFVSTDGTSSLTNPFMPPGGVHIQLGVARPWGSAVNCDFLHSSLDHVRVLYYKDLPPGGYSNQANAGDGFSISPASFQPYVERALELLKKRFAVPVGEEDNLTPTAALTSFLFKSYPEFADQGVVMWTDGSIKTNLMLNDAEGLYRAHVGKEPPAGFRAAIDAFCLNRACSKP